MNNSYQLIKIRFPGHNNLRQFRIDLRFIYGQGQEILSLPQGNATIFLGRLEGGRVWANVQGAKFN
jgi:hypothetical protein